MTGGPEEHVSFPIRAASWSAALASGTQTASYHSFVKDDGTEIAGPDLEIALKARGEAQAERALSLIAAALVAVQGSATFAVDLELMTLAQAKATRRAHPMNGVMRLPAASEATFLAAWASWRLQRAYAIAKLHLSMSLHSTHVMDLNPSHSVTIPKSADPVVHARLAEAIVLAYGALEELGLEVRASSKNPSTVGGAWNPPVLSNLESRLRAARVNPYDTVAWDVRGPKTSLERVRSPRRQSRAPWTRWPDVRDVKVTVVDAIAHTSWLRSKVAAHAGNKDLVRVLSAYDVANAQHVARYLLLTTSGILKLWFPSRSTKRGPPSPRRSAI